jgi:hypothetical protein
MFPNKIKSNLKKLSKQENNIKIGWPTYYFKQLNLKMTVIWLRIM